MPGTVIVEPDHGGHRYQAVANVAALAARTGPVVLLTTAEGAASDEFAVYLAEADITVETPFDAKYPPTRQLAHEVARRSRTGDVAQALVMDADQSLKRWWFDAWREFRAVPRRNRPDVVFMLTRYPTTIGLTDHVGWKLRVSKALLSALAIATGTLHRVAGFASRDDLSKGWLVKRARDPAICSAHSRDRAQIRRDLGLPLDRRLVGLYGAITERKFAPLGLEAVVASGDDTDLLLAGTVAPEVRGWLDALPADLRARVRVDDGFLPNERLDRYVAAADIALIALTNNGPSGIMGKALAAEVPVITAGSKVRAREIAVTRGGVEAELTATSIAAAIRRLLTEGAPTIRGDAVPPATGAAFAAVLLGVTPPADRPA